jgi:hypothetical protein
MDKVILAASLVLHKMGEGVITFRKGVEETE